MGETWPPKAVPEPRPTSPEKTEQGYKCGVCGAKFRFKYELKRHKQDAHSA